MTGMNQMIRHLTIATFSSRCGLRGVGAASVLSLFAAVAPAAAQSEYPNRPVQLIVPYGAGGIADVGMRILADKLTGRLEAAVRGGEPSGCRRHRRGQSRRVGCA